MHNKPVYVVPLFLIFEDYATPLDLKSLNTVRIPEDESAISI